MNTLGKRNLAILLISAAFGNFYVLSTNAEKTNPPPVIMIVNQAEYPPARGPGEKPPDPHTKGFPGGLIAVLWSDGRMIRPAGIESIGDSYVEGFVNASERKKFFAFMDESPVLKYPAKPGIPLHTAYKSISVYRDGKQWHWGCELPAPSEDVYELEARLWRLPMERVHAIHLDSRQKWGVFTP